MANKDPIYEMIANSLMYSVAVPDVLNSPVVIEVVRDYFAQCLALAATNITIDCPIDGAVSKTELLLVLPSYAMDAPQEMKVLNSAVVTFSESTEKGVKSTEVDLHRFSGIEVDE